MPRRVSLWLALSLAVGCSAPPAPPPPNELPVAEAGSAQTVAAGTQVVIDGSQSSDPEGDALTYSWEASPGNPAGVDLPPTLVRFSVRLWTVGTYWFVLTVSDGELSSRSDSVSVTVTGSGNRAPVADAGLDLILAPGSAIYLDGRGSQDPDGDPLTYLWQTLAAPLVPAIADTAAAQTTVTAPTSGEYRFRLTVSDGQLSHSDVVQITVSSASNQPPVADAGLDQQVSLGTPVRLDGSVSSDPEGQPLTYRWSVSRGPDAVTLSDSTAASPSFTPALAGEYVFALVVADGVSVSEQDVVAVRVLDEAYSVVAGMIEIPAGPFQMGTDDGEEFERPAHQVTLSTFWMDELEVTLAGYQACVADGGCTPAWDGQGCNSVRPDRPSHPINCVTWRQAADYCSWAGKRLPTEAEWEKAARGLDGRRFVWGDDFPDAERMNYGNYVGSTTPVGSYPGDVSYYGLLDMAGNVHEWTVDFYAGDYYATSPDQDPQGPSTGTHRVVRGASWKVGVPLSALTATIRSAYDSTSSDNGLGLRCARSQAPSP